MYATSFEMNDESHVVKFLRKFKDCAKDIGCSKFALLPLPASGYTFRDLMVCTNWPSDVLDIDIRRFAPIRELLFERVQDCILPFEWTFGNSSTRPIQSTQGTTPQSILEACLMDGYIIPVHGPNGRINVALAYGMKMPLSVENVSRMQHVAMELVNAVFAGNAPKNSVSGAELSDREKICLQGLSLGKSTADISAELMLSEYVVIAYIRNICNKLTATNRTHAVAKAIHLKLI